MTIHKVSAVKALLFVLPGAGGEQIEWINLRLVGATASRPSRVPRRGKAMTIEIPDRLIEYILLGSGDSRRHLQESPILGDVWVRYAKEPTSAADLLITSYKD